MQQLVLFEHEHPRKVSKTAPSRVVGGAVASGFTKHQHRVPMLSLDNAFSLEGVTKFIERCAKVAPKAVNDLVCERKIDGFAIS